MPQQFKFQHIKIIFLYKNVSFAFLGLTFAEHGI